MYRLKELRLDKGLKQSELANILMTTQATIGKYERGDLEPNLDFLKRLADFFEVSTDYLLGREDDFGIIQTKTPGEELTGEEKQLLQAFRKLNTKNRMHVVAYAEVRLEEQQHETRRA